MIHLFRAILGILITDVSLCARRLSPISVWACMGKRCFWAQGGWVGLAYGVRASSLWVQFSPISWFKISLKENYHFYFICCSHLFNAVIQSQFFTFFRLGLLSVHVHLDKQHRSLKVGHGSWYPLEQHLFSKIEPVFSKLCFHYVSYSACFSLGIRLVCFGTVS